MRHPLLQAAAAILLLLAATAAFGTGPATAAGAHAPVGGPASGPAGCCAPRP